MRRFSCTNFGRYSVSVLDEFSKDISYVLPVSCNGSDRFLRDFTAFGLDYALALGLVVKFPTFRYVVNSRGRVNFYKRDVVSLRRMWQRRPCKGEKGVLMMCDCLPSVRKYDKGVGGYVCAGGIFTAYTDEIR